jgi:hypothetical protein
MSVCLIEPWWPSGLVRNLVQSRPAQRYEGSNPVVSISAYDRKVELSLSEPAVGSNLGVSR